MSVGRETVLITGANGFLGRAACAAFTAAGFTVRALVRDPKAAADLQPVAQGAIFRCDLPDAIDERALDGDVRALIHCAYETRSASAEQARRTNVKGTETLVRLSRKSGVRQLVFVSSMAAHERAASVYGKTKFELEKLFDAPGDTVIKPATIVGDGGVFQRTREMLRRLPVLPLFYADRKLQTIWIEDACQGLLDAMRKSLGGTVLLAHPQSTPMREFYQGIAADRRDPAEDLPLSGRSGALRHPRAGADRPEAAHHVRQSTRHQTPAPVRSGGRSGAARPEAFELSGIVAAASSNLGLLLRRLPRLSGVVAFAIDRRDLRSHRPQIHRQLPPMVNRMMQQEAQVSHRGQLEHTPEIDDLE